MTPQAATTKRIGDGSAPSTFRCNSWSRSLVLYVHDLQACAICLHFSLTHLPPDRISPSAVACAPAVRRVPAVRSPNVKTLFRVVASQLRLAKGALQKHDVYTRLVSARQPLTSSLQAYQQGACLALVPQRSQ